MPLRVSVALYVGFYCSKYATGTDVQDAIEKLEAIPAIIRL